jgi:glucans biosynthesis protein
MPWDASAFIALARVALLRARPRFAGALAVALVAGCALGGPLPAAYAADAPATAAGQPTEPDQPAAEAKPGHTSESKGSESKAAEAPKEKKEAPKTKKTAPPAKAPKAAPAKPKASAAPAGQKTGEPAPTPPTAPPAPPPPPQNPFGFDDVRARAKALAAKPYEEQNAPLPDALKNLSYDQYRDIRFKSDAALWRYDDVPFQVQFYHRGFLYQKRVDINAIVDGRALPIRYSPDLFDFGKNTFPQPLPADLGFAGFRLHYPLKRPDYHDEFAVFLGASYFRAIGARNHYGLSARGLAIDTGLPKKEEFPYFREFWIQKPQPTDSHLTVFALLDSQSVTGAYRFVIHPGLQTTMDVTADLFIRQTVDKFGVAPLTSMFFHGENGPKNVDDFREEAHDSDGLLIQAGGEWIWRPLENPSRLQLSSYHAVNPRGFGLLQRDRDFDHYQDLESAYQDRPSLWVTPVGDWGEGNIHLIEIPVDADKYDNIVAFWWPKDPVKPGEEHVFRYHLTFTSDMLSRPPLGRVIATRIGAVPGNKDRRLFVLDFDHLGQPGPQEIQPTVSTSAGEITNLVVYRNAKTGGWRLSFELAPAGDKPIELRGYLKSGDDVLTETWSYQWNR